MANRTVSVHPTENGTGDASYPTLAAAITGELGVVDDLVTAEEILTIEIQGDWDGSPDTAAVDADGFLTSSDYYLKIVTASSNRASASGLDTSKYILQVSNAHALDFHVNYGWVDGLQISNPAGSAGGQSCLYTSGQAAGNFLRYSNLYLVGRDDDTNYSAGIRFGDADTVAKVWNCIIQGCTGHSSAAAMLLYGTTIDVYNCLSYNCYDGFKTYDNGTISLYNCVSFASDGEDFEGNEYTATIDHCASDDGVGTNDVAESGGGAAWPNDFEGAATGDFRLKSGSNLIGACSDASGGLFTDDIEGTVRGASWDVGPFEYVAAGGGGSIVPILQQMRRRRG